MKSEIFTIPSIQLEDSIASINLLVKKANQLGLEGKKIINIDKVDCGHDGINNEDVSEIYEIQYEEILDTHPGYGSPIL
jgi:hypothetical protein